MKYDGFPSLTEKPSGSGDTGADVSYQLGAKKTIYTDSALTGDGEVEVELAAIGDHCTIWRSVKEASLLSSSQAQSYAAAIDEYYDTMTALFGDWSAADVDQDGKTAFVFYSIPYTGYFDAADLYTEQETESATGNHMDMLHMNISETNVQIMYGTLAHELQHLINWVLADGSLDTWLDETIAQSAIAVNGLADSDTVYEVNWLTDQINENGFSHPFIYAENYVPSDESYNDVYGSWYLFGRYLSRQTEGLDNGGDSIYKAILVESADQYEDETSLDAMEAVLKEIGYSGGGETAGEFGRLKRLITNYNIAIYIRESTGLYSICSDPSDPNNVDGVEVDYIYETETAPEKLPGGGAACWVYNATSVFPVSPLNSGVDMMYAGISKEFPKGVTIDGLDSVATWGQEISLHTSDSNAKIYYTTDASDPLKYGTEYTGPIRVEGPMTISACTIDNTGRHSPVSSWEITKVKMSSVQSDVSSGKVKPGTQITLSSEMDGAVIVYTTDGSTPTKENGTVYEAPITINKSTTLKAVAYHPDQPNLLISNVRTFTYETGDSDGDRYEPNDTQKNAVSVSFPGKISATIHDAEDVDFYSFHLDNGASLSLTLTPPAEMDYSLTLLDEQGNVLKESAISGTSQNIRYEAGGGRYFVKVESTGGQASSENTYELTLMKELDSEAVSSLDFSERNMLTALTDQSSGYAYDLGLNGGGNFLMSMTYFANWGGPVSESDDPYPEIDDQEVADYSYKDLSDKAQYHVQNALYMPNGSSEENINHIKNAIYNYGAVDVYMLSAPTYMTTDQKNVYIGDYQYPTPYDGGHIVTIVGWDDNYSRDNFTGNPGFAEHFYGDGNVHLEKPERDGAFIVRNSWGEQTGENGYFYVSYEDTTIYNNNPAVFLTDEASDNYNHQYYYDIFGAAESISAGNSFTVEQKFENPTDSAELLRAVSFQIFSSTTRYEVSVTCEGSTQKVLEGVKNYAGFYTERLSAPVTIPAGQEFTVSVYLENTDVEQNAYIGTSCNIPGMTSGLIPKEGVSFITANNEKTDLGALGYFPCVRAYTCNAEIDSYEITAPELSRDGVDTLSESSLPDPISVGGIETQNNNGVLSVSIESANGAAAPSVEGLPARFDLRDTGTLTPIRNQGLLSSCWTFAATASAENTFARSGGFAEDYPKSLSLESYEKQILLTKDEPEQSVVLSAELMGSQNPSSTKIYWSVSGDLDSVKIDQNESFGGEQVQILTALKPGVVTITAQSEADMTVTAQCTVTITQQGVKSISLNPKELTLQKGETAEITATTSPENAMTNEIIWSSSRPEIASVNADGKVTAISEGTAVITAKAGTVQASATVTVTAGTIPNTGDSEPFMPAILAVFVSAAVAGTCLATWRRKKYQ